MESLDGGTHYQYIPNPATGQDRFVIRDDSFVIEVEKDGVKVEIHYFFYIHDPEDAYLNMCDREFWKISLPSQTTDDPNFWTYSSPLSVLLYGAQEALTGFADLPGTAIAQTTGYYNSGQIILDTNAAGWGWYIDPTPFDNTDDYLPTADPNIWKAKPGTGSEGKMDMLSVLLHEYGHILGLEHSNDPRNFMATTLQPGERRLPSAAELQLMADLVAQIKAEQLAQNNTPNPFPNPLPVGVAIPAFLLPNRRLGYESPLSSDPNCRLQDPASERRGEVLALRVFSPLPFMGEGAPKGREREESGWIHRTPHPGSPLCSDRGKQ